MCKNLVEKGQFEKPLILYNRTKKRADDLAAQLGDGNAIAVESITEVADRADIIFLCLSDDAAVNGAVNVITQQNVAGKVIVDCSTVHPDTTNALEKRLNTKSCEFVAMAGSYSVPTMKC